MKAAGREDPGRVHRRGGRRWPVRHRGTRCADPHARAQARAGHHGGMLGYGPFHYRYASGREGDACKLSIASNASYISMYCFASDEKGYVAERYVDRLPRAGIGKTCVMIEKLADLDEKSLVALIEETATMGASSPEPARRRARRRRPWSAVRGSVARFPRRRGTSSPRGTARVSSPPTAHGVAGRPAEPSGRAPRRTRSGSAPGRAGRPPDGAGRTGCRSVARPRRGSTSPA